MTTLNTIIEEEKVVARGKWIYKPENQTSSEVLDEIVTTAMQRVAKEVREERDTYWKERLYEMCGLDDPECWHGGMAKECKAKQCEKRVLLKTLDNLK